MEVSHVFQTYRWLLQRYGLGFSHYEAFFYAQTHQHQSFYMKYYQQFTKFIIVNT